MNILKKSSIKEEIVLKLNKMEQIPKSNFRKVCDFNQTFGLPHFNKEQINILVENKKLSDLRVDLCIEEVNELFEAFDTKNFIEVIDALTDELYVLYGAGSSFGIDIDVLFRINIKRLYKLDDDKIMEMSNYNILLYILENNSTKLPLKICKDLFKEDLDMRILNLKELIKEGINSMKLNKEVNNFDGVKENIIELLINIYKMGIFLGINLDKSFDIVHRSNMSKLCVDEDEAEKTVKWYIENEKRYDSPEYRETLLDSKKYWIIFNKSTGKILKSINYKKVNFFCMLETK